MTLTIELQPDIERGLLARATAKGISASKAGNFYDLFAPVRGLLTDEEIDRYFTRTPSLSRSVDLE